MPDQASETSPARGQLARNLVALRAQGNWSTRALAEQAHVDRRMIQRLERGELNVSLGTVDKLARALGVSTGSLLGARPVARQEADNLIEALLAQNLVAARGRLMLTQEMLSQRSGVSRPVIARIERQARNPSLQTLERLAASLALSMATLLTSSN
ncbi:helix-turn-helix transcriptional regulator [Hydrogenophaga sp.]|uniref:helix-turn-helix domain-containing protein n=1 Tax=Hydrogenophaga sp. TaxID=1904254 RepID=UPI0025BE8CD3|nr:helix-turn-helix transcriptional regulator [Hydrogenophaga sp.]